MTPTAAGAVRLAVAGSPGAVDLLTRAAGFYVGSDLTGPRWWNGRAFELLTAVGVDLVQAGANRISQSTGALCAV